MKWKAVVPIALILIVLALALTGCGPEIKERPSTTSSEPEVQEGPITTESGLVYEVLEPGEGPAPEAGEVVTLHFAATLEDGTDIGNTYEGGQPVGFFLGEGTALPGLDEGIALMHKGEKAKLVIPPELALGDQASADGMIPANSTLIFEVELLSIHAGTPEAPTEVKEADYMTTESGLKYTDLVVGDGPSPEIGQAVTVHYTGWLEDGTKFDSSLDRGQPFTFAIGMGGVIAGWDEGVATMKVGGKRQLVIPSELGYGAQGAGGVIPPNATLIFEVELLSVK